jgi:hypothetical protein
VARHANPPGVHLTAFRYLLDPRRQDAGVKVMAYPLDFVTRHVVGLQGDYSTSRDAAELLGISRSTLLRYMQADQENLGPTCVTRCGDLEVFLYSPERLDQIEKHLARHGQRRRRGRRAISSPEEKWCRRRRQLRCAYYARKAAQMHAEGRAEEANRYCAQRTTLTAELDCELRVRLAAIAEGFEPPTGFWMD